MIESNHAVLTIDLGAIYANYRILQNKIGNKVICGCVVKANAYGAGLIPTATALYAAGCRAFFVSDLNEGVALRDSIAKDSDIYILHGVNSTYNQSKYNQYFIDYQLTPVLNSLEQIRIWQEFCRKKERKLPAIIHIDTGMSRLGLGPAELSILISDFSRLNGLDIIYVMSHLSCADMPSSPINQLQLQRFVAASKNFTTKTSLANSAGIFLGTDYHFNMTRSGAALYGISPVAGGINPMHPVAYLHAPILQNRNIDIGDFAGYKASFVAKEKMRLATVELGYSAGFLRASTGGFAYLGNYSLPIIGVVSMDLIIIDITSLPDNMGNVGDMVGLMNEQYTIDMLASSAGTIGNEILISLGAKCQKLYINSKYD